MQTTPSTTEPPAPPENTSPPVVPVCAECGSDSIAAEAAARWSDELQSWVVSAVYDTGYFCDDCEGETRIEYKPVAYP